MVRSRFVLPLIVATLLIFLVSSLGLRITTINCKQGESPCSPEIVEALTSLKGKGVFFLRPHITKASAAIATTHQVLDYSITLPSTLTISVTNQTPAYQLKLLQSSQMMVVNNEGNKMSEVAQTGIPTIVLDFQTWAETTSSGAVARHTQFMQWLEAFENEGVDFLLLYWQDPTTLVGYTQNQSILFEAQNVALSLERWQLIRQNPATQEQVQQAAEIDVRFKLPVLRSSISVPRHDSL